MITYEICDATDTGLVRKNNEDTTAFNGDFGLCLLADGMGGYNAGEVASGMAVALVNAELGRWLQESSHPASAKELRRALEIAVQNANCSIFNAAKTHCDYAGMGTTLVVAVAQDNRLLLGHIGDSRCYRLRDQTLEQITKDHSVLQEQIDSGLITPEQALTSLHKNLITRAVGVEEFVQLESNEFSVLPGDLYMMCSDGLSDLVDPVQLAFILRSHQTLGDKSRQLIEAANAHGGRDNISVVLLQASLPDPSTRRGLFYRMLGK